ARPGGVCPLPGPAVPNKYVRYPANHPGPTARETAVFEAFCKDKLGPLALRLAVGLFCVYHGYLKIMAAGGTAWYPSLAVGWQVLIAWAEFASGLAVLLGFRCRTAATVVVGLTAGLVLGS